MWFYWNIYFHTAIIISIRSFLFHNKKSLKWMTSQWSSIIIIRIRRDSNAQIIWIVHFCMGTSKLWALTKASQRILLMVMNLSLYMGLCWVISNTSFTLCFSVPHLHFSIYLSTGQGGGGDNIWKHTNIILLCIIISKILYYNLCLQTGWLECISNWLILKCQIYFDIK